MLKRKLLVWILIFLGTTSSMAQLSTTYPFYKDDTVLRKSYYDQSVKKKSQLLASVDKANAKEYKTIYNSQFEGINELWKSSRPVTYAGAHNYLQAIVQKVIAVNPALKGTDARVVFSRDWWPNAVSMGDGTIAINAGLVMYMNNEAELAFVVCHELAHYYLEHTPKAIKKYIETTTSEAYQAELKRLSKLQFGVNSQLEKLAKTTAFNSRRHSRENEAEADRQAFIFLKNTGYDCNAIITCLQMLDKVDDSLHIYPPLNIEQTLNFKSYPFKKKWIQSETSIFSAVTNSSDLSDKEKDSLKTHPDCARRITLLADSVKGTLGNKKFLIDEQLFGKLQKDFFMEVTEECYREQKLGRNLYNNLLLLQANQNTAIAAYSISRDFNEMFEMQKDHKIGLAVDNESKAYPDDYNMLLRMIGRMRLSEIANLNYQFCLQQLPAMKDYPGFEEQMQKAKLYSQE